MVSIAVKTLAFATFLVSRLRIGAAALALVVFSAYDSYPYDPHCIVYDVIDGEKEWWISDYPTLYTESKYISSRTNPIKL